jgi:hypothetical protein
MNSSERLRQQMKFETQKIINIQRSQDASLVTWKNQVKSSQTYIPATVQTVANSAASGVMDFAIQRNDTVGTTSGNYVQFARGTGTNMEALGTIMSQAFAASSNDATSAQNPGPVIIAGIPQETRQRYQLVSTNGVVLDTNTYLSNLDTSSPGTCYGKNGNGLFRPVADCTTASATYYGGGKVFTRTLPINAIKYKFSSA